MVAMGNAVTADYKDDYIPFFIRFKAWWNGVDVQDLLRDGRKRRPQTAAIDISEPPNWDESKEWPGLRLQVLKRLWGEGFIFPGGPKQAVRLVKPARGPCPRPLGCG